LTETIVSESVLTQPFEEKQEVSEVDEKVVEQKLEPKAISVTTPEQKKAEADEHLEKCKVFVEWCEKVGIKTPKLNYPAFFDGGLLGIQAKVPIRHREVILSVPYDLLLSIDKAKADPILGPIYSENGGLFGPSNPDFEQLILAVFLMYEW